MFKDLLVLEKERSLLEAIGFYIAYTISLFIILIIVTAFLGIIFDLSNATGEKIGEKVGMLFALFMPMVIAFLIMYKRRDFSSVNGFIFLLSGICGLLGLHIGLIPVALLTLLKFNVKVE